MSSMERLTPRQTEVLDFIREYIKLEGLPPTIVEIAEAIGVTSPNGVRDHLKALERKGAIELIPHASRGIRVIRRKKYAGLPIVGRVAAGSPILAEENIEDHCQLGPGLFTPRADYLLRVEGMSMRDAGILDGDLLAVHRSPDIHNGQIVVARIGDEVTVKRLRLRGKTAYLEPENPEFETIKVNMRKDELAIEGVVVGVIRTQNL